MARIIVRYFADPQSCHGFGTGIDFDVDGVIKEIIFEPDEIAFCSLNYVEELCDSFFGRCLGCYAIVAIEGATTAAAWRDVEKGISGVCHAWVVL